MRYSLLLLVFPLFAQTNPGVTVNQTKVYKGTSGNCLKVNANLTLGQQGCGGSGTVTSVSGTANEIGVATGTSTPVISVAPTFDISGHTSTAPIKKGTSLPATCGVGEFYDKTDATAGSNLYSCTATNTWTAIGGGGGGATIPSVTNVIKGDGAGNGADSGIAATSIPTSLTGDATGTVSANAIATSVVKINGVALSGLATGLLKNTTTTGAPSIAVGSDICGLLTLTGDVTTSAACATTIANLAVTNAKIANSTIDLTAKVTGLLPSANIAAALSSQTSINGLGITASTGTLTVPNGITLNAGAGGTLGSNAFTSTAYLPLAGGTMVGNLIATDNTYDLGASGATRWRNLYLAGNATIGGLTSTRIPFAGTGGLLGDSANFTYSGGVLALTESTGAGTNMLTLTNTNNSGSGIIISGTGGSGVVLQSGNSALVGTTNAFPFYTRVSSSYHEYFTNGNVRINSGLSATDAGGSQQLQVVGGVGGYGVIVTGTRFTCTGDGCTPTSGGSTAGEFTTTTTGTSTFVITMGSSFSSSTASSKYSCHASNLTTANLIRQTASTATTATLSGVTVSGDTISFACDGV